MNLYVWHGPNVLPQYSGGIAFAHAESLEVARELIRKKILEYYDWMDIEDIYDRDDLELKCAFLREIPEVYSNVNVAFIKHGSE